MKQRNRKILSGILSMICAVCLLTGAAEVVDVLGGPSVTAVVLGSGGGYYPSPSPRPKPKANLNVSGKEVTVSFKSLLKKKKELSRRRILSVYNAGGTVTYKITDINKDDFKSYFKIDKSDGDLTIKKNVYPGTYKLSVNVKTTGSGSCNAGNETVKVIIKIDGKREKLSVEGKTAYVKFTTLQKRNKDLSRKKILTVRNIGGKAKYSITSVDKTEFAGFFKINKKTGALTLKKGLPEGIYKLRVSVRTTGSVACKAGDKERTVKINVGTGIDPNPPEKGPGKTELLFAKISPKGGKSLTITWNKVNYVDGYDIFFARCNHDDKEPSYQKIKTIKGNTKFEMVRKGLKKDVSYKAYVKAFIIENGKKTYVRKSPIVHTYTHKGKSKYTNAKKVTAKKTSIVLKEGRTAKVKVKVTNVSKKMTLISVLHAPKLRYYSNNKDIATVDKRGKIKAVSKGSCKIYILAPNGVRTVVKVKVN